MHLAEMDAYHEHFACEHRQAVQECRRLEELFKDVAWYNFETVARTWTHPWPVTIDASVIELHAQRYSVVPSRGGRHCEKAEFPHYYAGPVRDAPPLPPLIVLNELELARVAVQEAEEACAAPYEWAPGGRLYEKLIRESDGVKAYRRLSSNTSTEPANGLFLGDSVERAITEDTEATAEDILGRVCGDRSLVCS